MFIKLHVDIISGYIRSWLIIYYLYRDPLIVTVYYNSLNLHQQRGELSQISAIIDNTRLS